MTEFRELLARYRNESLSEAEKGTKFERLMRAYLLALPKYQGLVEKVWLWHDFPYRKDFGSGHDLGIDLVARTVSGEYWAIQCKCYASDAYISKESVDTFLATSGRKFSDGQLEPRRFSRRLWISTTDNWSTNAEESLVNQVPPVMKLGLAELCSSPVDWAAVEARAHGATADRAAHDPCQVVGPDGRARAPRGPQTVYRLTKMRFAKKDHPIDENKNGKLDPWELIDRSRIVYNDRITIRGIPLAAYDYVVNGKSALEWIMERYQVTTNKDSGIVNDPNKWLEETGNPRYIVDLILKVVTVSMETQRIVAKLPRLEFGK